MKKDMSKYVFKKRYDNFYLFTEFDVIFNEEFAEKLNIFYKKTEGKNLSVEIEVPIEYKSFVPDKVEILNPNSLSDFYEMEVFVNGTNLLYYMLNFFISDDSKLWEIYVSLENELSIIGCSREVSSLFEVVFNPYAEENLEQKYKIISDMFGNEKEKNQFINLLEENYQFSKF